MKKVLLVANTAWTIYNFRFGLLSELVKNGYKVHVIGANDFDISKFDALGVKYTELKIDRKGRNPINDLKLLLEYKRLYKKIKPDIIFQFTIKPNIYGTLAAKTLNIPVVNNVTGLGDVFLKENLTSKIVKILYKFSFKYPQKVFFQNYDDMNLFLENKLIKEKICDRLPGSGINIDKFKPMEKQINDKTVFLFIGRVTPEKGILILKEAAEKIKNKYNNIEFQILGKIFRDDPNAISENQLIQWTKEGIINYLGTSEDVRHEIKKSDCIILPSYYREGVPRTLIEAASMGKPIITTDNVGCRDIVENGYNGFLCQPKNSDSLIEKIKKFIELSTEERNVLGKNGRGKVKKEFDEKIVIEKYLRELM